MSVPFLLTIVLTAGGLLLPILGLLGDRWSPKASGYLASGSLLIALSIVLQPLLWGLPPPVIVEGAVFTTDLLAIFFSVAVLLVAIFVTFSSLDYIAQDPNHPIYYSLLLFTALGMTLLAFASDLLTIFVAWELMGLPTFILAGFRKRDPLSNEGAIKFFIIGALGSAILLYGISLLYGLTGSTNLASVLRGIQGLSVGLQPLSLVALALLIAGFGLKLSAVPFHMWVPDAYEGAPTTVSALLAAGTKKAGFAVALRVFLVALPILRLDWSLAFAILAVLTMTLGNVAALTQRSMTRLLAYSSIAQAGYILVGLAVAPFATLAIIGLLFHIFNHAIMKSSAFLAAATVSHNGLGYHLDSYNGLGRRMPLTAFSLTVSLLALAGVPPLNGFWSKLIIFAAAIEGGQVVWWAPWLAVTAVINSVFSLGYYAWVIKRMYLDEPKSDDAVEEPTILAFILLLASIIIIGTGIYPAPIYEFARLASSAISLDLLD